MQARHEPPRFPFWILFGVIVGVLTVICLGLGAARLWTRPTTQQPPRETWIQLTVHRYLTRERQPRESLHIPIQTPPPPTPPQSPTPVHAHDISQQSFNTFSDTMPFSTGSTLWQNWMASQQGGG
jgi:hypothetical protein